MLEKDLILTRGDTGMYAVDLRDANGDEMTFNENIEMYFTVKPNAKTDPATFQKSIGNGITYSQTDKKYHVVISPTDTAELSYGVYVYDITVKKDNDRFTVVKGKFTVDYEVTFIENEV